MLRKKNENQKHTNKLKAHNQKHTHFYVRNKSLGTVAINIQTSENKTPSSRKIPSNSILSVLMSQKIQALH